MENSSPCPCSIAARGQVQKIMAELCLHQNLTFERFLTNGLLHEVSFLLLQLAELGHSMCFGRFFTPCDAATQTRPFCGATGRGGPGLQPQCWRGWGGCVGMLRD